MVRTSKNLLQNNKIMRNQSKKIIKNEYFQWLFSLLVLDQTQRTSEFEEKKKN